ncbi:MAG: methyltransferase domain-containing protein [Clostridia bacterium]|nr:methyltransferase domain-containing protein [Clostridia bacterium]
MRLLKNKVIINSIKCPVCGQPFRTDERGSLLCLGKKTHCYDFSSSGYVNFSCPAQSGGGDSKGAVRARSLFLDSGAYLPVANAVCEMLDEFSPNGGLVIDAGCGEGYYSCLIANNGYSVCGADISKFAVDAAAKRATRGELEKAFFCTASVFELPLVNSCADAVVNIFAPCVEKEYSRVLKDEGVLVVAWAGEEHLMGLKSVIYDNTHINTARADLPQSMEKIFEKRVKYQIELTSNDQILNLFSMTPYYWRTSSEDREKLSGLNSLTTQIDIIISVYKNHTFEEIQ